MTESESEPAYHRMTAKTRRSQIVEAGLTLAKQDGLANVRRKELAAYVGISPPSLTHHFGDMENLRDEIVQLAISRQDLAVVGEAVALKYPAVAAISDKDRRNALNAYL